MAQTGFTPIQLYRSVTAATAPLAADLAAGELALNTTDEKLYFKNTGGTAKILANAAIAGIIPGTGVATALAVNVGSAGAPVINGGALGTPSSGTLTNATGLPAAGVTGTALVAAAIGTTVQAYDADLTTWAGITPGTGIGTALAVAVGTDGAPVIKSGALGTPSSGTVTNLTGTASININGTVGATTPTTGAFTSINGVTTDTTTNKPVTAASLAGGTLPASVTTLAASGFSILAGASFTSVDTIDCATSSLKLKGLSGTNMTITGPGDSTNRSVTFPAAAGTVVLSTTLNNGTLPASVTTLAASDTVTLTNGKVLKYSDVGFSRSTTATMFLGDGTAGDATGVLGATKLLLYPNAWANITNATSNVVQIGAGATTGYGGSLKLTNLEAVGALTAGSIIVTATAVPGANQAGIGLSTNYLQFVGGTTGTAINNHANSANLLGITNAGAVTIPGTLTVSGLSTLTSTVVNGVGVPAILANTSVATTNNTQSVRLRLAANAALASSPQYAPYIESILDDTGSNGSGLALGVYNGAGTLLQALRISYLGSVMIPGVYSGTTATAANVNVDSTGLLQRSTSALKYKTDIRDLESISVDSFRPVRYKSLCSNDDQNKDHFGIITDEVDAAGIHELVNYGPDGAPEGFQYERLTVVLLKEIQLLRARVATLESH